MKKTTIMVILLAVGGCSDWPDFDGPYCETVEYKGWEPAENGDKFDNNPMWVYDKDLEEYLWEYAGGVEGGFPSGNDIDQESHVALSPRAKHLTTLEFIATSFPDWETFDPSTDLERLESNPLKWFAAMVYQKTPKSWFDCGDRGGAAVQSTRRGREAVIYYPPYINANKVYRAGIVVHEVWHTTGKTHSPNAGQDVDKEYRGSYWMHSLFLAAVCHAPEEYNITPEEKWKACYESNNILKSRFSEPTNLTPGDLSDIWENFPKYIH